MRNDYLDPWFFVDALERSLARSPAMAPWPVFDIEDADDETILTADLPGLTEDDLEVTVAAAVLTIRGGRRAKDGRYLYRQRWHGTFERHFHLGDSYDLDDVRAHVADGVLTIRLAKSATARPRRIKLTRQLGGVIDKVKGLLAGDKDRDRRYADG